MAQAPAGGRAWQAFCGGGSSGRGGASRRLRAAVEEGILGLRGFRALRLKPIRILISGVIGNRLIPAGDFFLEKKQKRARCSGLPSRFILCRTCRAKAACLGGIPVCIPHAAGAACSSRTVRHARTRLWPCACAHRGGLQGARWLEAGSECGGLRGAVGASRQQAGEDGRSCAVVIRENAVAPLLGAPEIKPSFQRTWVLV